MAEERMIRQLTEIFYRVDRLLDYCGGNINVQQDNLDRTLEELYSSLQLIDIVQEQLPQEIPEMNRLKTCIVEVVEHWQNARTVPIAPFLDHHHGAGRPKLFLSQDQVSASCKFLCFKILSYSSGTGYYRYL